MAIKAKRLGDVFLAGRPNLPFSATRTVDRNLQFLPFVVWIVDDVGAPATSLFRCDTTTLDTAHVQVFEGTPCHTGWGVDLSQRVAGTESEDLQ